MKLAAEKEAWEQAVYHKTMPKIQQIQQIYQQIQKIDQ